MILRLAIGAKLNRIVTLALSTIFIAVSLVTTSQESQAEPTVNQNARQIVAGGAHTCAVLNQDNLRCWGNNNSGQTSIPSDLGSVSQISSGSAHECALRIDGSVKCWGWNANGQTNVPSDLGKVLQISAGANSTCAVTDSNAVRCWGSNYYQTDQPPSNLGRVSKVEVGFVHSCAIKVDGTVKCWSWYPYDGVTSVPRDLGFITELSVGLFHTCVVEDLGTVRCWGNNSFGQTNVPDDLGKVVQIAAGGRHTCSLNEEGEVRCWGDNSMGQISLPYQLGKVVQITVGTWHGCAITESGIAKCWGFDGDGQTDVPSDIGLFSVPSATPTIDGDSVIGSMVSAKPGDWAPGTTLNFQWLRDGKPILGATSSSYKLGVKDYLKDISVVVSGLKSGFSTTTKNSRKITPIKSRDVITSLKIRGVYQVDSPAYAALSSMNSRFDYTFQWTRNDIAIDGAATRGYTFRPEDVGKNISIETCLNYLGQPLNCFTQRLDSNVKLAQIKAVRAGFSGFTNVGRILTAYPACPNPGVQVSYQWLQNGKPIDGATTSSYLIPISAKGSAISLSVTVTKHGYETVTKISTSKLVK